MPVTTYAFDPTGTNPANRVLGEQHVITAVNFRDYNYFIPNFAPFFADNITISFRDTQGNPRVLTEGVDYYFSHGFISASKACAKPVFGSICFLDNETAGVIQINYQTIGGIWTLSSSEITSILADSLVNPRITAWEQITNLPITFPVVSHEWNLVDMVGASALIDELENIRNAILAGSGGGLSTHIAARNNPHEVSKEQVGLGNVQNYPMATLQQGIDGVLSTVYMSPAAVKAAIDNASSVSVATHAARTDNPHATTKTQVGLGNVDNFATASNAQALAGTATNLFMTPAATKVVADSVTAALNTHIADTLNPHAVTKDQVGLYNVQNYDIATVTEAQDGTVSNKYMTPIRVKQAISAIALTALATHTADNSNPHATTKGQVGLGSVQNYAVATLAEAQDATSNSAYMTPLRTAQTISALATQTVAAHANLANNPHSVTASQVGAYTTAQTDTLLNDKLDKTATAANTSAFESRSFAVAKAEILAGTASNSDHLNGYTADSLFDAYDAYSMRVSRQTDAGAPGAPYSYFKIATIQPTDLIAGYTPDVGEYSSTKRDAVLIISGGNSPSSVADGVHVVQVSLRNIITTDSNWSVSGMSVPNLRAINWLDFGVTEEITFGLSYSGGIVTLYARCPNGTTGFSVTSLDRNCTLIRLQYLGTTAPGSSVFKNTENFMAAKIKSIEDRIYALEHP